MPTGARNDPYAIFNFIVEIDGVTTAGFSEASGLDTETDIISYRTGDHENTMVKLPGLKKYPNITLKRGYTADAALWDWRKQVMDGQTQRKSGSVTLHDESNKPVLRWTFKEGWPSKLTGPGLNARNNEVAIETLEIAHEGLDFAPVG